MPQSDPSLLARVLAGERVFDLDTDSRILQAANGMSARLLFELFRRAELDTPEGRQKFAGHLQLSTEDPAALIGFDDGRWQGLETGGAESREETEAPTEYYLKLEFVSSDACFYQSPIFPSLSEPGIRGYSRRSQAQFQYLRLELSPPQDLSRFIAGLQENPLLRHVHESSPEEFHA